MKLEEVNQRTKEAVDFLVAALESGHSEVLTAYLSAMAKFHTYSFGNILLIARQKPEATNIAGIRTWNSLGRFVKRGEKGIFILAPMIGKKRSQDGEATAEDADKKDGQPRLYGFRGVYVFDITQTEGKELATLSEVSGDVSGYRERLFKFVEGQSVELSFSERIAPAKGLSHGGKITLLSGMQPAEEFSTLVHEIAQPPRYSPDLRALKLLVPDAADEIVDPEQWLFLDTETTGLAGGSGTYAFLVGIAWWEGGGLELEQFFLREYSEERSLLFALRERIAEHPVLVTFNGKSFDWPLLETRYRMSRKVATPSPRAHLDFLHPARNLWRLRLGSVRLSELERHILGWDRGADVLSGQIPQIYFDYLRGGRAEPLVPVLNHNQMDLRGLAALSSRILSLLNDAENLGQDGLELFGVSRICEKRGEHMRARKLYEKSIASFLPTETDRAARRSLARLAKREGDFDLACELWKDALGNSRHGYEAHEQLAMYYEHNARNPEQARQVVVQAINELRRANQVGDITPGAYREFKVKFDRRLERLERKSRKPLLDTLAMQTQS